LSDYKITYLFSKPNIISPMLIKNLHLCALQVKLVLGLKWLTTSFSSTSKYTACV